MGSAVIGLLPLIVAAALMPIWGVIALLLLPTEGGLTTALAFATGAIVVRLAQGVLFGYLLAPLDSAGGDGSKPVVSALLVLLGLLLFVAAFLKLRKHADPDDPSPMWMGRVQGMSALSALGAGALIVLIAAKQWVLTISAVGVVSEADVGRAGSVAAFLIYVIAAQLQVFIPIVICIAMPERSMKLLGAASRWLGSHSRPITVTLSTVFGAFFLWRGIGGLI
jgi:Sap, sulfolipid-1-addressing protein